ncbi:DUF2161 family putative PD-(D/E)XK-type phosphodiesterase [Longirhabdus pacifica]|uniref:DUF2161 family putative PD-(D/E)XK-type phosphodiesterase n=1 Tax=Longirhabdus pacifica TaxID=2305227 RepID=UPI00197E5853|nr:DUF2161 family putative PD-(D/E)XK-type phosphodiesterase [Longirhabdus pacifica]
MEHKEEDLYAPVRHFLLEQGYDVKGEVAKCDVMAMKDDVMIVVELKKNVNLELILQAVDRQRAADKVYVAAFKNNKLVSSKKWKHIVQMLRRLGIGIMLVTLKKNGFSYVDVPLEAERLEQKSKPPRRSQRHRKKWITEFQGRSGDFNTGGTVRKKLITAYKEKTIHIAAFLLQHHVLSIKQLKQYGTDDQKTATILQQDHYGWFERVSRGHYQLSKKGKQEIQQFEHLVQHFHDIQASEVDGNGIEEHDVK